MDRLIRLHAAGVIDETDVDRISKELGDEVEEIRLAGRGGGHAPDGVLIRVRDDLTADGEASIRRRGVDTLLRGRPGRTPAARSASRGAASLPGRLEVHAADPGSAAEILDRLAKIETMLAKILDTPNVGTPTKSTSKP